MTVEQRKIGPRLSIPQAAVVNNGFVPFDQRERHQTLWYDDGSIILATPRMLFRVYRGTLARHSPFFRDLFTLPQPSIGNGENTMDGVPIVELHDDPTELAHFLSTLHDHSYYCHKEVTDFKTVVAILRLSTKYQVPDLRLKAINHLGTLYHDTLHSFDFNDELIEHGTDDDAELIAVSRETGALHLAPVAFYWMAACWWHDGEKPDRNDLPGAVKSGCQALCPEDVARIAFGRAKLCQAVYKHFGKFLYEPSPPDCKSSTCQTLKTRLRGDIWWIQRTEDSNVYGTLIEDLVERLEGLCSSCIKTLRWTTEEARIHVWENLPGYFLLSDWETLRKESGIQDAAGNSD